MNDDRFVSKRAALILAEMEATAAQLEAMAEASIPLETFETIKLAVAIRDWHAALTGRPATPDASVTRLPPRLRLVQENDI